MNKVLFFAPKPEDEKIAKKLFYRMSDVRWEIYTRFVRGAKPINFDSLETISADVIVARGVTARAIKMTASDIPVVDLSVTGYDIIDAVLKCRKQCNAHKIGVVGAESMIFGAKKIEQYIKVEIFPVVVENEDDAEIKIRNLLAQGIDTIIGGGMSVQIGSALGMNTVFINSGPEAIYQALREAKRVARVRRIEQERTEQFHAILDYSAEGIIAVDKGGQINLANKAAMRLVGLAENVLGRPIDELIPQLGVNSVVGNGKVELGRFYVLGGQQFAVNCVPIRIREQIAGAVATFQPAAVIQKLEGEIRRKLHHKGLVAKFNFADIFAIDPVIRETVTQAREYSMVDSNVLILGETGTGKEIFAQSLHNNSARKNGPFVAVNCAALSENLLESELFGYVEGAFTGAVRGGKMGLFEQAHTGTIFLDEISEITPRIQGQLLRVLQEREIRRLGDDRVIPVDVRVIAATNRELKTLVQEGKFRSDLYYRLDVLKLKLPPLKKRIEDILPLLQQFMQEYGQKYRKPIQKLSAAAQNLLLNYSWPGNIRELRNIAERIMVVSHDTSYIIQAEDLQKMLEEINGDDKNLLITGAQKVNKIRKIKKMNDLELIKKVLKETNYNMGKTAEIIGISRTTLWRRLKLLDLNN